MSGHDNCHCANRIDRTLAWFGCPQANEIGPCDVVLQTKGGKWRRVRGRQARPRSLRNNANALAGIAEEAEAVTRDRGRRDDDPIGTSCRAGEVAIVHAMGKPVPAGNSEEREVVDGGDGGDVRFWRKKVGTVVQIARIKGAVPLEFELLPTDSFRLSAGRGYVRPEPEFFRSSHLEFDVGEGGQGSAEFECVHTGPGGARGYGAGVVENPDRALGHRAILHADGTYNPDLMKGVVLTGGKGSRLRPFTYSGAKQLVPIGNVPVLHFPVTQLVACGITEIALVVGDTEQQIRLAMGDGSAFGARFTYVRQDSPLGIAHALGMCRDFAAGESLILYLGDNVLLGGIEAFVRAFAGSSGAASVVLKEVADPRAFGVGVVSGTTLARVVEKPAEPPSNLAVIGVYAFRPEIFDVIEALRPSGRGEYEIADALNAIIARGSVVDAEVTADYWIDTGKMEDMLSANRAVLGTFAGFIDPSATVLRSTASGAIVMGAGARVEDCVLTGPVAIGPGARLRGSRIGPDVAIGANCDVANSSLSNSIVMESCVIRDCPRIVDSMLGRFVHVECAAEGTRLVLGDHSRVEGGA